MQGKDHKKYLYYIYLALLFVLLNFFNSFAYVDQHYDYIRVEKYATENEDGIRVYKLSNSDDIITEKIPATGHEWSDWIIDIKPTYTTTGHRYRVCKKYPDNPHIQEEIIPMMVQSSGGGSSVEGNNKADIKESIVEIKDDIKMPEIISGELSVVEKNAEISNFKNENNKAVNLNKTDNVVNNEKLNYVSNSNGSLNESQTYEVSDNEQVEEIKNDSYDVGKNNIVKKEKGSLIKSIIFAPANVYDAVNATSAVFLFAFYILILWPLVTALLWIAKKKKEKKEKYN